MGTNYYLRGSTCKCCGQRLKDVFGEEELHIGKSSAGWVFALRVWPEHGVKTLGDWVDLWFDPKYTVYSEYGDAINPWDMLRAVVDRKGRKDSPMSSTWLNQNQATEGPHGLARAKNGVAGPGTWDLIDHEFS